MSIARYKERVLGAHYTLALLHPSHVLPCYAILIIHSAPPIFVHEVMRARPPGLNAYLNGALPIRTKKRTLCPHASTLLPPLQCSPLQSFNCIHEDYDTAWSAVSIGLLGTDAAAHVTTKTGTSRTCSRWACQRLYTRPVGAPSRTCPPPGATPSPHMMAALTQIRNVKSQSVADAFASAHSDGNRTVRTCGFLPRQGARARARWPLPRCVGCREPWRAAARPSRRRRQ